MKKEVAATTSCEEIDKFQIGNNFIKITGAAKDVGGLRSLSNGKSLFRSTINNGKGRRVRVLAWDEDAADMQNKIKVYGIYSLARLRCVSVNPQYFKESDGVIDKELHVTSKSKLTKHGVQQINPVAIKLVKMAEIADLFSTIRLQGFISDRIEKDKRNSRLTCGSGAITDGHVQVQVNVFDISPTDEPFKVGTHVEVCGRLTRDKNYGLTYIQCGKMSNITKVDDEIMSDSELSKNFVSPQPKRSRTQQDPPGIESLSVKIDNKENKNPNSIDV